VLEWYENIKTRELTRDSHKIIIKIMTEIIVTKEPKEETLFQK